MIAVLHRVSVRRTFLGVWRVCIAIVTTRARIHAIRGGCTGQDAKPLRSAIVRRAGFGTVDRSIAGVAPDGPIDRGRWSRVRYRSSRISNRGSLRCRFSNIRFRNVSLRNVIRRLPTVVAGYENEGEQQQPHLRILDEARVSVTCRRSFERQRGPGWEGWHAVGAPKRSSGHGFT